MKKSISTSNNSDWVCLNVGGKVFQTTKDTLSQHPESFLARLVNGDLPSEKDETGAYLIDRDPEHFSTVLNYLRSPVLNLDGDKKVMKELLCEADFYNIQQLVNDIRKAIKGVRIEMLTIRPAPKVSQFAMVVSETQDDYEVLLAIQQRTVRLDPSLVTKGLHFFDQWQLVIIETILRNFGFEEEKDDRKYGNQCWKFVRTVNE